MRAAFAPKWKDMISFCEHFCRRFLFLLILGYGLSHSSPVFGVVVDPETLAGAIGAKTTQVPELAHFGEIARRHGVRLYLFGGSASTFANYVRQFTVTKDPKVLAAMDFHFEGMFFPGQDIDLLVDGQIEAVKRFQSALEKDPFVRSLGRRIEARSVAEMTANPDFFRQNTDTMSLGMVELTGLEVTDLNDVQNRTKTRNFLTDLAAEKITFLRRKSHFETALALEGKNPEIFGAIRFLTKAYREELAVSPADEKNIREIIAAFDPAKIESGYPLNRLVKLGEDLFGQSADLAAVFQYARVTGLAEKLIKVAEASGQTFQRSRQNLIWWLNKEPLKYFPLGGGSGKTAEELGIRVVSHGTPSDSKYESITFRRAGKRPRLLKSRERADLGESAGGGDGFYALRNEKQGLFDDHYTVKLEVSPKARLGSDFLLSTSAGIDEIIFLNSEAVTLVSTGNGLRGDATALFAQYLKHWHSGRQDLRLVRKYQAELKKRAAEFPADPIAVALAKWTEMVKPVERLPKNGFRPTLFREFLDPKAMGELIEFVERLPKDALSEAQRANLFWVQAAADAGIRSGSGIFFQFFSPAAIQSYWLAVSGKSPGLRQKLGELRTGAVNEFAESLEEAVAGLEVIARREDTELAYDAADRAKISKVRRTLFESLLASPETGGAPSHRFGPRRRRGIDILERGGVERSMS